MRDGLAALSVIQRDNSNVDKFCNVRSNTRYVRGANGDYGEFADDERTTIYSSLQFAANEFFVAAGEDMSIGKRGMRPTDPAFATPRQLRQCGFDQFRPTLNPKSLRG